MTGFQRLCILTCVVIVGLIILGGVVRATESGLGCPDWPLCHGKIIPEFEKHTLIEWSHRTVAAVVGFMVLGIIIMAFRSYRHTPAILYPAVITGVLLLIQAGLGGLAVLNELPAEVIMVHLGMALTILTLLMLITATSFSISRGREAKHLQVSPALVRVAFAALAGTLILMLIGSYVSGAGYGLACAGWPLCNGQVFPADANPSVHTHFLHRFLALIVGLIIVALIWVAWKARDDAPMAFRISVAAGFIFVVQSLLGAANIWTQLSEVVRASHLALATILWLHLAILNIRIGRWDERLPRSSTGESPNSGLARAAR